jgi:hypothetical protein
MPKKANSRADDDALHQHAGASASPAYDEHEAIFPPSEGDGSDHFDEAKTNDIVSKAATIAVVGVGVALISAELIPGMLIGVAAAFLPGLGPKLRPWFRSTVRAGYSAARKTREMVAEAGEQIQDIVAEAKTEKVAPIPPPAAPATPRA